MFMWERPNDKADWSKITWSEAYSYVTECSYVMGLIISHVKYNMEKKKMYQSDFKV